MQVLAGTLGLLLVLVAVMACISQRGRLPAQDESDTQNVSSAFRPDTSGDRSTRDEDSAIVSRFSESAVKDLRQEIDTLTAELHRMEAIRHENRPRECLVQVLRFHRANVHIKKISTKIKVLEDQQDQLLEPWRSALREIRSAN